MVRLWWSQWVWPPPQRWFLAAEHPETSHGVAPSQPDTTRQDLEVSRRFMGCSAVAVADPPPTARHGWKSRRCCCGRGSGVGGWVDEVEWLERVEKCGEDSPEKSTGKVFRRRGLTDGGWTETGERGGGF
ncbi:hypothetical protein Tco_0949555 [Tanacetum coccineum]